MKAKEMAKRFQESPTEDTLKRLLHDCIMESKDFISRRNVQADDALAGILRELDDKWRAFARLCPQVNPDGFKVGISKVAPVSKEMLW